MYEIHLDLTDYNENFNIGFVYSWRNLVNGKRYIGSHKGHPSDGYLGSGRVFNRALKNTVYITFEEI